MIVLVRKLGDTEDHAIVDVAAVVREINGTLRICRNGQEDEFVDDDVNVCVVYVSVAMTAPRKNGRLARVEGRMEPYGDGYQLFASAVEFK